MDTVEINFLSNCIPSITPINSQVRNIQSNYSKSEKLQFPCEPIQDQIIVVHIESRTLKIGIHDNNSPRTIPNVVAVRRSESTQKSTLAIEPSIEISDLFALLDENTSIEEHPVKKIATDTNLRLSSADILVGDDVNKVDPVEYRITQPFKFNRFNTEDYSSEMDAMNDFQLILSHALKDLGIDQNEWKDYSVGLIVADTIVHHEIQLLIDMFLKLMGFHGILLLQESVAASFGAGSLNALVLNINSDTSSVACIDEGCCLPDSCFVLEYGGNDVARALYSAIKSMLPEDFCLDNYSHFKSLCDLSEQCSFTDRNTELQNIAVRNSDSVSFYEVVLGVEKYVAPLVLFNPTVLNKKSHLPQSESSIIEDPLDTESKQSTITQKSFLGLDVALLESVKTVSSAEKTKKLLSRIVLAGDSSSIPGLPEFLATKIDTKPFDLEKIKFVKTKEHNATFIHWKGASVAVRQPTAKEMWLSRKDWSDFGLRALKSKINFSW